MIILDLVLTEAWYQARKVEPITLVTKSSFPGRIIGVTLSFLNRSNRKGDTYTRKTKGRIKSFLCSVYHLYKHDEQKYFYNELVALYKNHPRQTEIIIRADTNFNAGVKSKIFRDLIGPNRLDNRNIKGKIFLFLLKVNKSKLILSYFKHSNYVSYRSFDNNEIPHMFDNFIRQSLSRRIYDGKLVNFGVTSDHTAAVVKFLLTAIKFINAQKEQTVID